MIMTDVVSLMWGESPLSETRILGKNWDMKGLRSALTEKPKIY
jgi:hypothetical protein